MNGVKYGEIHELKCPRCYYPLEPCVYEEKELNQYNKPTGRIRNAVSYLYCPICGETSCVDDSFDGGWYKPILNCKENSYGRS